MSTHLSRTVAVRLAIGALTLAIPAAWTAGRARTLWRRIRYGRGLRVPGLPGDGEPLTCEESAALGAIDRGWKHTARTERTRA